MKKLHLIFALLGALSLHASVSSVDAGGAFTISLASVEGTAPFTYQWAKEGVAIAGATGATYTKTTVVAADAGNYTVRVTNSAGSTVSDVASITIIVKPPSKAVTAITSSSAPVSSPSP